MIGVLKSKGVPVLWVGLPAMRGPKATADMLFLDALYRDAAGKAGITYVDVWDGFVDEAGRFLQQGPDFEGQIRQLRSDDGVYFTKAGARKLAHYVEREVTRLLGRALRADRAADRTGNARRQCACPASRRRVRWPDRSCRWWRLPSAPINCSAAPARAPPRSMRSPRARWSRAKPLAPPAGRADDFAWPRREIGREQAKGETPVAAAVAGWHGARQRRGPKQPSARRRRSKRSSYSKRAAPARRCRCAILRRLRADAAPFLRRLRRRRRGSPRRRRPYRRREPRRRACRARRACRTIGRSPAGQLHAILRRFASRASGDACIAGTTIERSASSRNSASAAAGGAAGASSTAPAQSRCRRRPAARRADCPARFFATAC